MSENETKRAYIIPVPQDELNELEEVIKDKFNLKNIDELQGFIEEHVPHDYINEFFKANEKLCRKRVSELQKEWIQLHVPSMLNVNEEDIKTFSLTAAINAMFVEAGLGLFPEYLTKESIFTSTAEMLYDWINGGKQVNTFN
jgi:U3 small nucleolar ribonucleoprotein component